jgi:hypothetical protein
MHFLKDACGMTEKNSLQFPLIPTHQTATFKSAHRAGAKNNGNSIDLLLNPSLCFLALQLQFSLLL